MAEITGSERYGGTGSPEEMEKELVRQKLFRDTFGIEHRWEPEAAAPRITDEFHEKIRAHVRHELSEEEDNAIWVLSHRFRSVTLCCAEIAEEEMRRRDALQTE